MSKGRGGNGRVVLADVGTNQQNMDIQDLGLLLNQYAASEPVRNVLEKTSAISRDLVKDLLIDASDLLFDLGALDSVSGSRYPPAEQNSVITFSLKEGFDQISDPSLEVLQSSNQNKRKWINFIGQSFSNRLIAISVPDESDYWRVLRALRLSSRKESASFSCRCQMRKKELGGKAGRDDILDITCEIKNGSVKLAAGTRLNEIITLDINEIAGLTVIGNYPFPSPLVFELKFTEAEWENRNRLEMTVASNSVHQGNSRVAKLGGTVCVVLKTEEIKSAAATIVITNGARGSDNAIIAELTYPFSKLIKDDASPAQLKLDEPIRLYFPLKEATNRRLAKINIYRAENLYTPKGSPPSPFCAVYLLNNQRDRIRMFKKELLTSVVKKSSNPVWDAEIELQGPLGIEGVAFVVVQIRDHGMTGLDPKPLGQVVIPISTFMFGKDDGQVTLPIEPTDRMAKVARGTGAAPLGTLVFHAELADLPASGVRRPTSQQLLTGNAILDCTLRTSAAEGTWWPMKLLSEAAEERTSLPSGGGYLACGFDSLLLHFLRPEGGAVSGLPVKECLRGKDVIAVPWSQVREC